MKLMSFLWFAVLLNLAFGICGGVFIPLAMPDVNEKFSGTNPLPFNQDLQNSCTDLYNSLHGFNWNNDASAFSNMYYNINNALQMVTGLLSVFWNFVIGTITFFPNIITYFFELPEAFTVLMSLPIAALTAFTFIQLIMGSNRSFLYFE